MTRQMTDNRRNRWALRVKPEVPQIDPRAVNTACRATMPAQAFSRGHIAFALCVVGADAVCDRPEGAGDNHPFVWVDGSKTAWAVAIDPPPRSSRVGFADLFICPTGQTKDENNTPVVVVSRDDDNRVADRGQYASRQDALLGELLDISLSSAAAANRHPVWLGAGKHEVFGGRRFGGTTGVSADRHPNEWMPRAYVPIQDVAAFESLVREQTLEPADNWPVDIVRGTMSRLDMPRIHVRDAITAAEQRFGRDAVGDMATEVILGGIQEIVENDSSDPVLYAPLAWLAWAGAEMAAGNIWWQLRTAQAGQFWHPEVDAFCFPAIRPVNYQDMVGLVGLDEIVFN